MFKPVIVFVIIMFSQLNCSSPINNSVRKNNNEFVMNSNNDYYEAEEKKMFEKARKEFLENLLEIANKESAQRGINPLTSQEFVTKDFEIRIWVGFGEPPQPQGFILEKKAEKWRATYLSQNPKRELKFYSIPSKVEWDVFWRKLESSGLLTIPDSVELGRDNIYTDARLIFVEIKQGDKYRNYSYVEKDLAENMNNEQKQSWERLKEICFRVSDEFHINLCDKE